VDVPAVAAGAARAWAAAGAAIAILLGVLAAAPACAQPPPTDPVVQRPKRTAPRSTYNPGPDRNRFEIGTASVQGYFDILGTFGYRCFVRERTGWIQTLHAEATGSNKGYLGEGSGSVYYFFRPRALDRPRWLVRPILEAGPGAHLVVQGAHIRGMSETAYHARTYVKGHLYGGFEVLASERVGLLLRGRMSLPARHPFDYAQAAIFLR
jgi:hypothetical protein